MHAKTLIRELREIDRAIDAGDPPETIRAMVRKAEGEARRWQSEIAETLAETDSLRRKAGTHLFSRMFGR